MPERDPVTGRFISNSTAQLIANKAQLQNLEALNKGVLRLNADLDALVKNLTEVHNAPDPMGPHSESLAIAAALITGLNAAFIDLAASTIEAGVNFERQQISLQAVTGSVEAATAQYERLLEVARLPGINIEQALAAVLSYKRSG